MRCGSAHLILKILRPEGGPERRKATCKNGGGLTGNFRNNCSDFQNYKSDFILSTESDNFDLGNKWLCGKWKRA
jgi:hypothetical protein